MSKQEILSWTSFATSLSAIIFYVILILGWPGFLPDVSDDLFQIFFNIFWIAVGIEIVVEIIWEKKKVQSDERDFRIEAIGNKFAYNFIVVVIIVVLGHLFLSGIFGSVNEFYSTIDEKRVLFHLLILSLFTSSLIRRAIMIYHYRKDFII
ncbi:MAG: hypothetical protein U5K72_02665 [Balneolaceae bacterium]|nr:hypothetical protein [Balneolaceae bacterium]